jgi:hypothetical protein
MWKLVSALILIKYLLTYNRLLNKKIRDINTYRYTLINLKIAFYALRTSNKNLYTYNIRLAKQKIKYLHDII